MDWIELQWCKGETVNNIADCLSGLHWFGNCLNLGGELTRPRKKAALLTVPIVCAVIARALELDELAIAALIALSCHYMLPRKGEALALQFKALELGDEVGVCSLYSSSKSGLRTGSEEAVSIRDPLVLDLLHLDIWLNVNFEGNGSGLTQANPFGIDSKLICNFSALAIST